MKNKQLIVIHIILMMLFMTGCLTASSLRAEGIPDSIAVLLNKASAPERAEILLRLAVDSVETDPEFARNLLEQAMATAKEEKDWDLMARVSRVRADASYYLKDYADAAEHYQSSADQWKRVHGEMNSFYISRLGDVAFCYDVMEMHDVAVEWYTRALELARRAGIREEEAASLANLGKIETIRGNYEKALEMMTQALAIDRMSGDLQSVATDLNTIGKIYQSWDRHQEAIGYFEQAMEIDQAAGRDDKVAIRLNSIGSSFLELQEFQKALGYFQQALAIDRQSGNEQKVAVRLNNIGLAYAEMKDYPGAIDYIRQAVAIFESLGLEQEMARGYHHLAKCYFSGGDPEQGIFNALRCSQLAEKHKMKPLLVENHELLSMIYSRQGDFKNALSSYQYYSRLKDEIFTEESDRRMADFYAMYETEKEKQKNELLVRDNLLKSRRIEIIIIIFSSIALILVMVIVILRFIAASNKNKRMIAEHEAEKLNLELETRNKELAYNAMCIIKNNETMSKMIEGLELALHDGGSPEKIRQILHGVSNLEKESNWKEFEVRFTGVHKDFYDHLEKLYPDLTPNERKICAFLRLNMSTKDIASLTHQSINSINVARTRLRKKMNLDNSDENLVVFLAKL